MYYKCKKSQNIQVVHKNLYILGSLFFIVLSTPLVKLQPLNPQYTFTHPLTKFIDMIEHKLKESQYPYHGTYPEVHSKKNLFSHQAYLLCCRDVIITTVPYHLKNNFNKSISIKIYSAFIGIKWYIFQSY